MSSTAPARRDDSPHGEVDHAGHGHHHEPVVVNGVSSDDEPSVEWGWHGHYPKVARTAGLLVAAALVVMALVGNHVGDQENIWLFAIAIGLAGLSLHQILRARTSRWR